MLNDSLRQELDSRLKEIFSGYSELAGGRNYRYHHLDAARRYAVRIASEIDEDVDMKLVEIAAMFHDIGRAEDIENGEMDPIENHEGHAEKGAEAISDHIGDLLDRELMEKVEGIIRRHHSEPELVEGKVVQDADLLYKYGLQGLWRKFHWSAEKGETFPEAMEYFHEQGFDRLEDRLDDFHFGISRKVAEKRLESLKDGVKTIEDEFSGNDI